MDAKRVQRISKALADPRRREILGCAARAEEAGLACAILVERLPISQPTISHHVKELQNADLVDVRADGQYSYLTLRRDTAAEYLNHLQHLFDLRDNEK
jgi:DNA-binding transcriptional ArsR family regulator